MHIALLFCLRTLAVLAAAPSTDGRLCDPSAAHVIRSQLDLLSSRRAVS